MLKPSRPAQSLLEAIIAIGVILVATISATTLIVTTISSGRVSADKIQAANFAREGVEIVRAIRDSNWLKRAQNIVDEAIAGSGTTVQWDDSGSITDGYAPMNGNYLARFDQLTNAWSLVSNTGSGVISALTSGATTFYTQACTGSCTATKYSRLITISPNNEVNVGNYLLVTATVTWNNHGPKTQTVTERLYDWR